MSGTILSGFSSVVGMASLALSQLPIRGGRHLKAIAILLSHCIRWDSLSSPLSLAHCKLQRLFGLKLPVAKCGVFPSPGPMLLTPYPLCRERGLIFVC